MVGIFLDSNVYLGSVLPNHPWKSFIDNMLLQIDQTTSPTVCVTSKVRDEVDQIINQKSDFILEKYWNIIRNFSNSNPHFSEDDFTELKSLFNAEISLLSENKDENHKLLLFIEEFLLSKIAANMNSKQKAFHECFTFFRNFNLLLKNTARNLETQYHIIQIHYPSDLKNRNVVSSIQQKLNLDNQDDAAILALFIHYLQSNQIKGIFLTFDFHDFLVHASRIESDFPGVKIFRPNYLQCLL